jgi:hypothetical protein
MSKHTGLSQLADTAQELLGIDYYPVRKRGLPRQLHPNRDAIAWLEETTRALTEIVDRDPAYGEDDEEPEFIYLLSEGYHQAATRRMAGPSAIRPMIQLHRATHTGYVNREAKPCPACDNWAYTAQCTEHPDPGFEENEDVPRSSFTAGERALAYNAQVGLTSATLEPGTITLNGYFSQPLTHPVFAEITSDTIQSPSSTLRIEVERDA